jgi:hypothetical protein
MSPDEWNKSDSFYLELFSSMNPMDRGFEGLEKVLEAIESLDPGLRPDKMRLRRRLNYSRQTLRKRLHESYIGETFHLSLERSRPPEIMLTFASRTTEEEGVYCSTTLRLWPFSFLRQPGQAERCAGHLVSFVRAMASSLPLTFGLAHSSIDLHLGTEPTVHDLSTPRPIYETFWLNVYGPAMVQAIGRQRLLSTPAALMEELPHGAVLWLTRPTPADFDSEEARLAQARALVHLRPELSLDSTLATLRQRSLEFSPIPLEFDSDVADILRMETDFEGLCGNRALVERLNRYHPPPVSEWLPAAQAPAPDVDNVRAAIDTYEGLYSEQLVALFYKEVPQVMKGTLEALPHLDWHLWHMRWGKRLSHEQRETLVPALGAFLGRYLVDVLGGRWLPRKKLEEAAVVIGDRAWLPFLRARHALQNQEAPLDFSCSQLFRTAQRLARAHSH